MSKSGDTKNRHFTYALNMISNILVIMILIIAILLVTLRIFGFNAYTIMSGSMEPSYPVGSLIYTTNVNPSELHEGDVITFMNDETTIVTHRIKEVITETTSSGESVLKFRTQGDANSSPDGKLVHYKNVLGTPTISIPYLGYISHFLQRPPGIYIAIIIGTFLISLIIIPSVTKRKEVPTKEDQKSVI